MSIRALIPPSVPYQETLSKKLYRNFVQHLSGLGMKSSLRYITRYDSFLFSSLMISIDKYHTGLLKKPTLLPKFHVIPISIIHYTLYINIYVQELNLTVVEVTNDMLACTWQEYLQCTFNYPFRELFLWAVLNNMEEMALLMWEHEEEGMVKAILGAELYRSIRISSAISLVFSGSNVRFSY